MFFMEIIPSRVFNSFYIVLDIIFLCLFVSALYFSGRKKATFFALCGGILYWIVDYGIFYLLLHSRVVNGAPTGLFLLWLSMSYGITNFAWIYLMLSKDKNWKEWTIIIFFSWIAIALLSQNFGSSSSIISISRTTNSYHGVMALILIVGYAIVAYKNIFKGENIPIGRLLLIGIAVQFGWEAALLVTGIRQSGIETLVVNSLIETNLGLPYIYFIHRAIEKKYPRKNS